MPYHITPYTSVNGALFGMSPQQVEAAAGKADVQTGLTDKQEVVQETRDGDIIYYYENNRLESIDFPNTAELMFEGAPIPLRTFAEAMQYFARHDVLERYSLNGHIGFTLARRTGIVIYSERITRLHMGIVATTSVHRYTVCSTNARDRFVSRANPRTPFQRDGQPRPV